MANFGLTDLRLVAPRDGWPSEKARAAASGADTLDDVRVFDTAAAAVADLTFVEATTARVRDLPKRVIGPREATAELRARRPPVRPPASSSGASAGASPTRRSRWRT